MYFDCLCCNQVWDSYGRLLFQSSMFDNTITSVGWRPDGELFAVGSFNTVAVCDKRGVTQLMHWFKMAYCLWWQWAHSREKTKCGSVLKISWTSDGTQLAGAGANGQVLFGQLVDRHLEWGSFDVCLDENDHVKVTDTLKQVCSFLTRMLGGNSELVCVAKGGGSRPRFHRSCDGDFYWIWHAPGLYSTIRFTNTACTVLCVCCT